MSVIQYLSGLVHRSAGQRGRRLRRCTESCRLIPRGEALETRQLLTGNVTATYDSMSQILTFTGDADNNEVTIRDDGPDTPFAYGINGTTINGAASLDIIAFTGGTLTAVVVNAGDGGDIITLDTPGNAISFPGSLTINGENGDDTVYVGAPDGQPIDFGALTINGNSGNDTVSFRSDLILPGIGQLNGGADNDTYVFDTDHTLGSISINEVDGGIDTLDFSPTASQNVSVDLQALTMAVNSNLELDLMAGSILENVNGGAMNDTLKGNAAANQLMGNGGGDLLEGRLGNNTLNGGTGDDQYQIAPRTTAETDTLSDGSGFDYLLLAFFTTDVTINLSAAPGTQTVSGSFMLNLNGNQFTGVSSGSGNDILTGRASSGTAFNGNEGNDKLNGGSGNDFFYGSGGNDVLSGWAGNDTYIFDTDSALGGESVFDSGSGIDTFDFSGTTTRAVSVNLGKTTSQLVNAGLTLTLSAGNVIENAIGGAMVDTIFGNELPNLLNGNGGDDLLIGAGGSDSYVYNTSLADAVTMRVRGDSPEQTVNLTGIVDSVGGSRPLNVTATSSNTSVIPNPSVIYASPNSTGSLKFTPVANKSGNVTITVLVEDGGPDNNLGTPGDNVTQSSTFTVQVTALRPVVTAPLATTTAQRPVFSWTAVSGAGSYRVYVSNQSTGVDPVINVTVPGTSYTPVSDLGIGRYTLWVQAITLGGVSLPWTAPYSFRIDTPVALLPITRNQPTSQPVISWTALPGATHYDFWLDNVTTGVSQLVRDPAVMTTSWAPGSDLPMGLYRVWVRGIDAGSTAARWSAAGEFVIATPPVPTAPLNSTFEVRPQFTWDAVLASPGHLPTYSVYLRNMNTGPTTFVYNPTGISGTDWTPPADLPDGLYRWWVQAVISPDIKTLWSSPIDLNIGGRPFVLAPTGATPTFNWLQVTGAVSYNLWVNRTDVFTDGIINLTGLTGTAYTPGAPLVSGTYRVWVQAVSAAASTSLWSLPLDFTVAAAAEPAEQNGQRSLTARLQPIVAELDRQLLSAESARSTAMVDSERGNAVRTSGAEDTEHREVMSDERLAEMPLADTRQMDQGTARVSSVGILPLGSNKAENALLFLDHFMTDFSKHEFTLPQFS